MKDNFLKVVAIIDGGHIAYRAYYKYMNMSTLDGVKTGMIYGVPFILKSLITKIGPDKVIGVFDGGSHKYRLNILPEYRQRDKKLGFDYEDFNQQMASLKKLLMGYGIPIVQKAGWEADDWIYRLALDYKEKGYQVYIVSGDKDFNQAVDQSIHLWNTNKNFKVTHYNMEPKLGISPKIALDYLCLTGDNSDNIPGVPGIGEKTALKILSNGSARDFIKSHDKVGRVSSEEALKVFKRNRKLISLKHFYRRETRDKAIPFIQKNPPFNKEVIMDICKKYQIQTLIKPEYLQTFKELKYGK